MKLNSTLWLPFLLLLSPLSYGKNHKDFKKFLGISAGYAVGSFDSNSKFSGGSPGLLSGLGTDLRAGYYFSENFGVGGLISYAYLDHDSVLLQDKGTSHNLVFGVQLLMRFFSGLSIGPFIGVEKYSGDAMAIGAVAVSGTSSFTGFAYGWTMGWDFFVSESISLGPVILITTCLTHNPKFFMGNFGLALKGFF